MDKLTIYYLDNPEKMVERLLDFETGVPSKPYQMTLKDFADWKIVVNISQFEDKHDLFSVSQIMEMANKQDEYELLEILFGIFNSEENPLSFKQDFLKTQMKHPHTSMSAGDIVQIDLNFYLCGNVGWKRIEFIK